MAAVVYLGLHFRAIFLAPFFDDWPVIEMSRRAFEQHGMLSGLISILTEPIGTFWRPLHILLTAPVFGESAIAVQIPKLAAVIGVALMTVHLGKRLGLTPAVAWGSGIALLLHQTMVLGGEIDRWGDVIMMLALLGLTILAARVSDNSMTLSRYVALVTVWTTVAIASKEAGVVLPVIPISAAFVLSRSSAEKRRHLFAGAASAIVVLVYLSIRIGSGIGLGSHATEEYYQLKLGLNLLENPALVTYALLSPVSTVHVVIERGLWLLTGATFALVWAALMLRGLTVSVRRNGVSTVLLLAILFVAVQGPSLLMKTISEPNIARSLPFGLLLGAIAVERLWKDGARWRRRWLSVLLAMTLLAHMHATADKINHLMTVSERARTFRNAVASLMPVPPNRPVVFLAERTYQGYSCYVQPLWRSLEGDADSGMRLRYRDPNYVGVLQVRAIHSDSLLFGQPDFLLDRRNVLTTAGGQAVQIVPLDPYVDKSMRR